MINVYYFCFLALLAFSLLPILWKPRLVFEYPHFMGAVFAVFILPQVVSLTRFPGSASPEAVQAILAMCCLCLGMCLLSYRVRVSRRFLKLSRPHCNGNRLFTGGLIFVSVGYFFSHLINGMSEEETGGSNWTGMVTVYLFFSSLIFPGFAICLTTALRRRRSVVAWLATVAAMIPPLQSIILAGRREVTIQTALTVLLTLFFLKRYVPPRLVILGAIIFATLAIPATGIYRAIASENAWEYLPQVDLVENFQTFMNSETSLELRNGAILIDATKKSHSYELGRTYWDQLVFRFVPAQFVGVDVKNGLMFDPGSEKMFRELTEAANYQMDPGTTLTGMGDTFQQFGYLGCLFFAALGIFFRNLYATCLQPEATFAQIFYIQIATAAMRTVTHQTVDFLPTVLYHAIFLGLLMLFAKTKPDPVRRQLATKPVLKTIAPTPVP